MTPDWIEVVEQVQAHFVEQYEGWVAERMGETTPSSPEVAFQLAPDTPLLRRLYRVDFATNGSEGPQVVEFWPERMLGFEPLHDRIGEAEMLLEPFMWSQTVVTIEGTDWDEETLLPWFDDWFGLESGREARAEFGRPGGMIHSASVDGMSLHVDFGSAPAEALVQLVELAEDSGATRIAISNEDVDQGAEKVSL